ncbi:hypothetical protein OH764_26190 [Burkholderia sp. M6-3]
MATTTGPERSDEAECPDAAQYAEQDEQKGDVHGIADQHGP